MSKAIEAVRALNPGKFLQFDPEVLRVLVPRNQPHPWNHADMVLEAIVGSAYEFSYFEDIQTRRIVFCRRKAPLPADGRYRTYVSPDRRHLFDKQGDGLYQLKP